MAAARALFQYPLMDRLYFGGKGRQAKKGREAKVSVSSDGSFVFWGGQYPIFIFFSVYMFQYPLMDRLYFGGYIQPANGERKIAVSVSSDGSFVFWGGCPRKQGRPSVHVSVSSDGSFVFWGARKMSMSSLVSTCFSIL